MKRDAETIKRDAEKAKWSRLYLAALRRHVTRGTPTGLQAGLGLGERAVALGLEPLDVAGIHERALLALSAPNDNALSRTGARARAKRFFAETTVPIEKTHGAVQKADSAVRHLTQTLLGIHLRMLALKQFATAGSKSLAREVAETQRKARESVQNIRRMARAFGENHET